MILCMGAPIQTHLHFSLLLTSDTLIRGVTVP